MTRLVITTPGTGVFFVPQGVSSLQIEGWGGGGAGNSGLLGGVGGPAGGGGAGGYYVRVESLSVTPGSGYYYYVGSGTLRGQKGHASIFYSGVPGVPPYYLYAPPGGTANGQIPGDAVQYEGSRVGEVFRRGGHGGSGYLTAGGGGGGGGAGGSGSVGENGQHGAAINGGPPGTGYCYNEIGFGGGGSGGSTSIGLKRGVDGLIYGGGGGGAAGDISISESGGLGAKGLLIISYSIPPFSVNANIAINSSGSARCTKSARTSSNVVINAGLYANCKINARSSDTVVINASFGPGQQKLVSTSGTLVINSSAIAYSVKTSNSGIPLYIYAHGESNAGTPLFLKVGEAISETGTIPLFMGSLGTGSGHFAGIDLYIDGDYRASGNVPLFIKGPSYDSASGFLNLFIGGKYLSEAASIPLYIGTSGAENSIYLYVRGSGTTDGALPANAWIPLYLSRNTTEMIPLYLQAPGTPSSGDVPLMLFGGLGSSGDIPLFCSGIGIGTSSIKLYCHGF